MAEMQSFTFDTATLMSPISAEKPSGELLRNEGTYDRIAESRREDDPNLAFGVWSRELKRADWNSVSRICVEALETRAKDLQLAAWLLESWIHLHGFSGLRAGCQVMVELCRKFWDSLYPSLTDPDYRMAPIHWMNEKLFTHLKFVPITSPGNGDSSLIFSFADWESAFRAEQTKHLAQTKQSRPEVTLERIEQGADLTPAEFFESAIEEISAACAACTELEAIFDEAFGKNSCSLGQFREVLESILGLASSFRGETTMPASEIQEEVAAEPEVATAPAAGEAAAPGRLPPIRSRAEAYRRLAEVADYLIRAEPHSPAPYLIRRAISWGGMTLEQLLPELVGNDAALKDLARLLKIDTVASNGEIRKT